MCIFLYDLQATQHTIVYYRNFHKPFTENKYFKNGLLTILKHTFSLEYLCRETNLRHDIFIYFYLDRKTSIFSRLIWQLGGFAYL